MPENLRRIEEATASRLAIVNRPPRPLWQIILLSLVLLSMLVLILVFWTSGEDDPISIPGFISLTLLVGGILALFYRVFPKKRTITFDKGRGVLEIKRSPLMPVKVIDMSLSDVIGVGPVRNEKTPARGLRTARARASTPPRTSWELRQAHGIRTATGLSGGYAGSRSVPVAKRGRQLVVLIKAGGTYRSILLYSISEYLGDRDRDLVRRIGEFLNTKALVKGTLSNAEELFAVFSGEDLDPEIAVEDFSERQSSEIQDT